MATPRGRSVWALPGRVDHPMSRGAHRLLREGAQLVEDPDEILGELGFEALPAAEKAEPEVSPLARRVLDALLGETLSAEELSRRSGHTLAAILVEVVSLEMSGRVARTPGGLYRRLAAGE